MLWKIDPLEILQTIETCKIAENTENEYAENAQNERIGEKAIKNVFKRWNYYSYEEEFQN